MTRTAFAADAAGAAVPVLLASIVASSVGVDPLAIALTLTFGIAVLAAAMGPQRMSGAHLAPALSLGLLLTGRVNGRSFLAHVGAQGIGLALALALVRPV